LLRAWRYDLVGGRGRRWQRCGDLRWLHRLRGRGGLVAGSALRGAVGR
jgi:hypothetical protein